MPNILERVMNGLSAFREGYMYSGDIDPLSKFGDYAARNVRYAVLFSHYENNAYRDVNTFAQAYKASFGLYRHTRSFYSPAYRIAEFSKAHIWGGPLDPEAGDGKTIPTALPIITDNDALRESIAKIFGWSNWSVKKNVVTLKGTILGDAVLKVVDDVDHKRVYLRSVHPGTLKEITVDETGNVKSYLIEELRLDPNNINSKRNVTYAERASRNGDMVVYETFLNGKPYAWPDNVMSDGENDSAVAKWEEPYGFIPMVVIQHNDVGLEWGWSELHPAQSKIREADDLASKLSDQIRKSIAAPMLLAGVTAPSEKPTMPQTTRTANNPQPGREELPFVYGPMGASAHKLYSDINIEQTAAYIQDILKSIEGDYPELRVDPRNITGDISGRALRILRQDADDKINERRPLYDDALTRALQMAVSIGAMRGYPEFSNFGLDSYQNGDMDFRIGKRPVFTKDPSEDLDYESQFWDVAMKAKNSGMGIPMYLEMHGWEQDDVDKFLETPEYQARLKGLELANTPTLPTPETLNQKRTLAKPKESQPLADNSSTDTNDGNLKGKK
jgi:hypothetical protein